MIQIDTRRFLEFMLVGDERVWRFLLERHFDF